MRGCQKTRLEDAVLGHFHKIHRAKGFPLSEAVRVLERHVTPCGRYVEIESDIHVQMDDGYLDLEGSYIEMKGLPNGIMAVVMVNRQRVTMLEFTTYGGDSWDGNEDDWAIV